MLKEYNPNTRKQRHKWSKISIESLKKNLEYKLHSIIIVILVLILVFLTFL